MPKKIHGLLEKYSRYCPRCKTYQGGIWQECEVCKTTLIDAKKAYKRHRVRKIAINILVILLLVFATYGIQLSERRYYNSSIGLLLKGKFHESKEDFLKASSANPLYKSVSSVFQKTKKIFINTEGKIEESK